MKKFASLFVSALMATGLMAQDMPQPSPSASVTQRVGLTDITVEYSRPGVKGRTVFGELVPFNQLWRTGANKATKVTVSTPIMFGDKTLEAGSYSLFTIPTENEWTIVFNTNTELWGTGGYSEEDDALRLTAKAGQGAMVERFSISFENMTDAGAELVLAWDKTEVVIPFTVDAAAQTEANISKALNDGWRAYRNAASYYSGKGEHDKALETIDQSLALNDNWYSQWVKAEILAAKGETKAAKKQGEKAIEMGQEAYDERKQEFVYRAGLEKEMQAW